MPSNNAKIKKILVLKNRLRRQKQLREKREAYYARINNFVALKDGLIKKFVEENLDLEDRQQESIFKITDTPSEDFTKSSGYFHACTAFGKTYLMMAMAEGYRAEEKQKKIVIFEESQTVLEQVKQDFVDKTSFRDREIGAFYGKEKIIDSPIIICTYASMEKMIKLVGKENIGLALCDEAHHILSENRQRVAKELSNTCLYGFTATPDFNEDKNCEKVFGSAIDKVNLRQGVESGLLCGVKNGLMVSKIPVDLTGIKNTNGDYDDEKLLAAIEKASHTKGIRESLAEFYLNATDENIGRIYGKTTIINVPNQKEADTLARVMNETAGKTIAKAYHTNSGSTPLDEFNRGDFPVLIQINRISEGYSNPKVEICINYPTASQVREAQCSGRAIRRDKNNPNKMALVLDIVFKKEEGTDLYQEIAANGQVLFADIAKDVQILTPELKERQQNTNNLTSLTHKEKTAITEGMLFDVIINYQDLYTLAINHLENLEQLTPVREKLDTDVNNTEFQIRWRLRQNGNAMDQKAKSELWQDCLSAREDLFVRVKSRTLTSYVLPQENIPTFKQWLFKETGIKVLDEEVVSRQKLDTDVDATEFQSSWRLFQNDKTLDRKAKSKLWQSCLLEREEFFVKVMTGGYKTIFVLPQENIPDFKQWLFKEKVITAEQDLKEKLDTDVDKKEFNGRWRLRQNGNAMDQKAKSELWQDCLSAREDLFVRVKSGTLTSYVLPQENIPTFKQWLFKEKGIKVLDEEVVSRQKLDTDVDKYEFNGRWRLRQNGNAIGPKAKSELWQDCLSAREDLFVRVKSGTLISYVLPQENIPAFKQWLFKEKGITTVQDLREKLDTDVDKNEFNGRWCLRQNGKALDFKAKSELWQDCLSVREDLFTRVKSGSNTPYILPQENISAFKQWLFKEKGITTVQNSREKLDTDVDKREFQSRWRLCQDGKALGKKAKSELWQDCLSAREDLFVRVKSGIHISYILSQENIPAFKQWLLKEKGIKVVDNEGVKEIPNPSLIAKAQEERA